MTGSTLSEPVVLPMPSPKTALPGSLGAAVVVAEARAEGAVVRWWRKLGLNAAAGRDTSVRQHTVNVRAAPGSATSRFCGLIAGWRTVLRPP